MTNKAASNLASQRWAKIPKAQRAALVPKNGGRKRLYPKCARYRCHVFAPKTGRCPCGFVKPDAKARPS